MDSATETVRYYYSTRPPLDPETVFQWVLSTETADYVAVAVDQALEDWAAEGVLLYGSPIRIDETVVGLNSEYVT